MSPHGLVIWALAAATWLVVLVPLCLWRRHRGAAPAAEVPCITDAPPPLDPEDPAFDSAYAVEAGADGDEQ